MWLTLHILYDAAPGTVVFDQHARLILSIGVTQLLVFQGLLQYLQGKSDSRKFLIRDWRDNKVQIN